MMLTDEPGLHCRRLMARRNSSLQSSLATTSIQSAEAKRALLRGKKKQCVPQDRTNHCGLWNRKAGRTQREALEEKTLKKVERVSPSCPHKAGIHKVYGKKPWMGTTYTGTSLEEGNHASNQGDSYCPCHLRGVSLSSSF